MSDSAIADAMRSLCAELFAAHQRLDPEAIKRLYADQADGIYFWERALSYDIVQVARTVDALATSVAALTLTPGRVPKPAARDTWVGLRSPFSRRPALAGRTHVRVDGRLTTIAEKFDGRWQILHDHAFDPAATEAVGVTIWNWLAKANAPGLQWSDRPLRASGLDY